MTIKNGQLANEQNLNAAFLSKKDDTSTTGKLALNNVDAESGPAITNVQMKTNDLTTSATEADTRLDALESATDVRYWGDELTDGSWRIFKDGPDLKIEIRIAGVWTTKDTFTP